MALMLARLCASWAGLMCKIRFALGTRDGLVFRVVDDLSTPVTSDAGLGKKAALALRTDFHRDASTSPCMRPRRRSMDAMSLSATYCTSLSVE